MYSIRISSGLPACLIGLVLLPWLFSPAASQSTAPATEPAAQQEAAPSKPADPPSPPKKQAKPAEAPETNKTPEPKKPDPKEKDKQPAEKAPSESEQPKKGQSEKQQPDKSEEKPEPEAKKPPAKPKQETSPKESKPKKVATKKKESKPAPTRPPVSWGKEIQKVIKKKNPQGVEDLRTIQEQVREVVAFARPATVGVRIGSAVGSAVIVSEDGLVLTAGHVAMEPNKRVLFFFEDGRRARGITLGVNRGVDSGMMKITDKGPWPYVPMAPTGANKPGNWVVGLGQPNGFFRDRAPPVRLGRVLFGDSNTVCTDVTLVGGDSGGPLFNLKGEVVGIHSRIGRKIVSNFHIPIDQYHTTWDRLAGGQMWGGRLGSSEPVRHRPLLGLAANSLDDRCEVTQVFAGMPAHRAGIKPGDIVTRFGDDDVKSIADLSRLVLAQKIGARVRVEVVRDGKPVKLRVRLGRISTGFPGAPAEESKS